MLNRTELSAMPSGTLVGHAQVLRVTHERPSGNRLEVCLIQLLLGAPVGHDVQHALECTMSAMYGYARGFAGLTAKASQKGSPVATAVRDLSSKAF